MTLLGAEMRHVYNCRWIIGKYPQNLPRFQRQKSLARLQNGQGAQ